MTAHPLLRDGNAGIHVPSRAAGGDEKAHRLGAPKNAAGADLRHAA